MLSRYIEALRRSCRWMISLPVFTTIAMHASCRKPLPGLFREAATKYDIELGTSYMIGDRWRDVDAGAAAGCRTVLIDYGYDEQSSSHSPDQKVLSLREAVAWIVAQEENAS